MYSSPVIHEQRWKDRRTSWAKPAPFDKGRYGIELLLPAQAKQYVEAHHYSGSCTSVVQAWGLFEVQGEVRGLARPELVGVAIFSTPSNERVITSRTSFGPREGLELGRFVLADKVPHGGESHALSKMLKALAAERPELMAIVAYSDPMERADASGHVYKPGHVGSAYQATGALYGGLTDKRTVYLTRNGELLNARALSKIIGGETGAAYAERQIEQATGLKRLAGESGASYVQRARKSDALSKVRHPGNHIYAWALRRSARAQLAAHYGIEPDGQQGASTLYQRAQDRAALAYPKKDEL